MRLTSLFVRPLTAAVLTALLATALGPAMPVEVSGPVKVRASETTHAVNGSHDFELPADTTHVAVHWPGNPDASVRVAFSADGTTFSEPAMVEYDEAGEARGDGETYGAVTTVDGARFVRVLADRPLDGVTVLAMDAAAEVTVRPAGTARVAGATPIPAVIPRSAWGADESIRFDSLGDERWLSAYYPLQKLIVHHTAGSNVDSNPAATVRAIYYYHAVSQDWGDIGYQYLIDSAGRVYEGRYSRSYWNGASPTADNGSGLVIGGGHALQHNAGSMGIAVMGTFDSSAPSAAARASLVSLLAWAAGAHGIDPTGSSTYVNPVTGLTRNTANIAGHRNYNSTGCPGAALQALLPSIRTSVRAAMNTWSGETYDPPRSLTMAAGSYTGRKFTPAGAVVASKPFTLTRSSGAPTSQKATIPTQPGAWYYLTAGVWAGYWIQESGATVLGPAPIAPTAELLNPTRPLNLAAGTYVGRKFSSVGGVIASRTASLTQPSSTWTNQRSTIPNQSGNWYYVTAGLWTGYWIQESARTVLGAPPPEPAPPLAEYDPPQSLRLAAGTYVGRQFNAYGMVAKSKSATLVSASSAPTSEKATIPNQTGNWYYITAGLWAGYWIQESPGTTLGP